MVLELPDEVARFRFSESLNRRLHALLDKQDEGVELTPEERSEAEALVEVAEMLTILRSRVERAMAQSTS
jgi:hypothetical protein